MDETFDLAFSQPKCPGCGTVLRDVKAGYVCVSCNQAYALPQARAISN